MHFPNLFILQPSHWISFPLKLKKAVLCYSQRSTIPRATGGFSIQSCLCLHEPDYKLHAQNCQHHHLCVVEASQNLPGASVINTSSLEYCSSINKNALKQTPRASRDQCDFFSYWLQARNAVAVSWFRDALPLFVTGSPDKLLTPTCWTDWGVNIFCSPRGCDEGWKRSAGTKRENI